MQDIYIQTTCKQLTNNMQDIYTSNLQVIGEIGNI